MKLVRIVPIVFLFAVGCGKAKAKTEGEKVVDDIEAMSKAVCACKETDMECKTKAMKDSDAVEERLHKAYPDQSKIPKDVENRVDSAMSKLNKCSESDEVGENPTPDPTAGTGDQDKLLADMTALRDAVCKCPDQACFDTEIKKGDDFEARMKALGWTDDAAMPADMRTKIGDLKKGVEDCAAKLGGGQAPPAPAAGGGGDTAAIDKVVGEFEALRDEICACADMACAQAAFEKGDAIEAELKTAVGGDKNPPDVEARLQKVQDAAKACVEKLSQ
jgi:hypothetical protein